MNQYPQWFYRSISDGLKALWVLRLPFTPSEELIDKTEDIWVQSIWSANIGWDQGLDAIRIHKAFLRLTREAKEWPAPRQLLERLPDRPPRPRLPKPPMSEAKRKANRERLRSMIAELGLHSTRGDHHE